MPLVSALTKHGRYAVTSGTALKALCERTDSVLMRAARGAIHFRFRRYC